MAKGKKIKTKKEKKEKQPREYKPLKTYFTQKTFLGVTYNIQSGTSKYCERA